LRDGPLPLLRRGPLLLLLLLLLLRDGRRQMSSSTTVVVIETTHLVQLKVDLLQAFLYAIERLEDFKTLVLLLVLLLLHAGLSCMRK